MHTVWTQQEIKLLNNLARPSENFTFFSEDLGEAMLAINTGVTLLFVIFPSSTSLFTIDVEGVYFHVVTLKHTPQSVGLLWTGDQPVAETST
jgi:hypothetical protein